MREMEFTMSRPGLVNVGDRVEISEGKLPGSNYIKQERLISREGLVKEVKNTKRGFFVVVEFKEEDVK